MRQIVQEQLLPDTKPILRSTVEISEYRGKLLVRAKDAGGYVQHRKFALTPAGSEEAHQFFWECAYRLQEGVREGP